MGGHEVHGMFEGAYVWIKVWGGWGGACTRAHSAVEVMRKCVYCSGSI